MDETAAEWDEDAWSRIATALGGSVQQRPGSPREIVIRHEEHQVRLDVDQHAGYRSESVHTRFWTRLPRAPVRLRIFHQELAHAVARLLGMQDIQVGDPRFDRTFVVQADDAARARSLLEDPELRRHMLDEPELEITLGPSHGAATAEEGDVLTAEVPGAIEALPRLRRLFDVLARFLQRLHTIPAPPR